MITVLGRLGMTSVMMGMEDGFTALRYPTASAACTCRSGTEMNAKLRHPLPTYHRDKYIRVVGMTPQQITTAIRHWRDRRGQATNT